MACVPTGQDITRRQIFERNGNDRLLELPELDGYAYILDYLAEIGWITADGNGVTFQEIESWSRLTKTDLTFWESGAIKNLSNLFANQMAKKDPKEKAPYVSRAETKEEASKRLKAELRG